MTEIVTKSSWWKPGQSGNPKGRPPKNRALTAMLREYGGEVVIVEGHELTAQQALARAVWQFALTGTVQLTEKYLEAESASEWAGVVKWLYTYVEPPQTHGDDTEHEMIVRVIRADPPTFDDPDEPDLT